MLTPAPDAPVVAVVVIALVLWARTWRSAPPFNVPPNAAVVNSSISAIATDAPIPTDSVPVAPPSAGSASVSIVESDSASSVTSAVPALIVAPFSTIAVVLSWTMLIATETLMPTSPSAAPLVVEALNVWVEAIVALTVAPFEVTVVPAGTSALLVTRTKLTATPMPTAASPPSVAAPLPAAAPSVSDSEVSANAPVALYASGAMYAVEIDLWMLMPTAAATLIGPELLSADGVSPPPSPSPAVPPLSLRVSPAKLRSPAIWLSTLCEVPGSESSSGAPAADAVADAVEVDLVEAATVSVPAVVLIARSVYASAEWFAMLSARAMPIAASLPSVSPRAVVTAEDSLVALRVTLPPTETGALADR